MNCSECKFWYFLDINGDDDPAFGECRRNPPTGLRDRFVKTNGISGLKFMDATRFEVITHWETWCGEYVRKVDE